ncbi:TetR/AcrR family transcriptional regulator [Brachybacterium sp. NPDC056505]|uniref:TetR/AcrR family transcriptional regulator n=1 Tax=Brachybacterium sp. NPDC056505 TaxID=3345843 RepID=UPI00366E06F4
MTQSSGTVRPGGRTERTRTRAHDAVRTLLAEGGTAAVTFPAVAERSGVHPATLYRRWRTPEALLLDVAAEQLATEQPVPVTGDLRADLTVYARRLARSLTSPERLGLFRAMAAAATAGGMQSVLEFVAPRLDQFADLLEGDDAEELTPMDLFELVLSPLYLRALLSGDPATEEHPLGEADAERLVDNVLAVRAARRDGTGRSADTA